MASAIAPDVRSTSGKFTSSAQATNGAKTCSSNVTIAQSLSLRVRNAITHMLAIQTKYVRWHRFAKACHRADPLEMTSATKKLSSRRAASFGTASSAPVIELAGIVGKGELA